MRRATVALSVFTDRATALLAVVGGVALLALVVLIFAGVVLRYAFGQPILGSNEIIQLAAVALVMSALPYCTHLNGHVSVDVFDRVLGRFGRRAGDVIARLLSGYALGVLCHRAYYKALDAAEFGDTTNMLGLPLWPFYGILALGCGFCVLVFALQILKVLVLGEEQ
ncbi:TRAP transporter small permease [Alloyangia pacifica]|uniref:TRAP transporter small permease protein n=1 Tax=Alloyangia pacifica TaxID=311180 RepID=A0A1I6T1H5_9RHOB|nr:TRAP transporter small permease [Alloyangia pacifica]SDG94312.1 TRAP-type C4-dicarboxylate transport system, small permease component [Alloyangia pacifica]SFS83121.1 TRAP-type C4-dicarboxylate transport system, small permease component [Alloyangia pacifica]